MSSLGSFSPDSAPCGHCGQADQLQLHVGFLYFGDFPQLPLQNVAEELGMESAQCAFVGSEAEEKSLFP